MTHEARGEEKGEGGRDDVVMMMHNFQVIGNGGGKLPFARIRENPTFPHDSGEIFRCNTIGANFPLVFFFQDRQRQISSPEFRRTFKKSKPINKQLTPDDEFLPEPARLKSRFRGRKRVPVRDGGGGGGGGMEWIE